MMEIKNKKVGVIGLGKTGFDTAMFLLKREADVFVSEREENEEIKRRGEILEKEGVKVEIGNHSENFLKDVELVVLSPGVSEEIEVCRNLKKRNIPVISEIELAYKFSPSKKIIAITGTNGKTTTTSLVGFIFKKAEFPSVVCGNIGNTFIGEVEKINEETWVILEVSSFQLEKISKFTPFIACLLNIAEDHLDRYKSFKDYVDAKKRIFENQKRNEWAILNCDDNTCREISEKLNSRKLFFSIKDDKREMFYRDGIIFSRFKISGKLIDMNKTSLSGKGNIYNVMAGCLISLISGVESEKIKRGVYEFTPLPHRFEKIAEINGITFINDSKATNPHAVLNSVSSVEKGKIILILGGRNKALSFSDLKRLIKEKVKLLILFGEAKEKIANELKNSGVPKVFANSLKEVVKIAVEKGRKGDTVLFSPGCASFDMFENYKERGDAFKREVQSLL